MALSFYQQCLKCELKSFPDNTNIIDISLLLSFEIPPSIIQEAFKYMRFSKIHLISQKNILENFQIQCIYATDSDTLISHMPKKINEEERLFLFFKKFDRLNFNR